MIDPMPFGDFPKAVAVERGCGEREPGGIYAETGLSKDGTPLEAFLLDPPLPLPDGLDLPNKPQLWQRMTLLGEPALDEQGQPIYDLLIWVGAEHYKYCPDYIEETRRFGASRKLNPNLALSLLSRESRMILAHPHALNILWQEQHPPQECDKGIPGHDGMPAADRDQRKEEDKPEDTWDEETDEWDEEEGEEGEQDDDGCERISQRAGERIRAIALAHPALPGQPPVPERASHTGPCLYKLWDLIPQATAETAITLDDDDHPLCLRRVGSTTYQYRPTGESADGLQPGLFAALPITGFALIRFADGSVNEKAKQKVVAGLEAHGSRALLFYESER